MRAGVIIAMVLFTGALSRVMAQSFRWVKHFQTSESGKRTVETGANGESYLVATFENSYSCGNKAIYYPGANPFTLKCDPEGNCLWMKKRPLPHSASTLDENGYLYIAGVFSGEILYDEVSLQSKGETDIYLAKYSPEGILQWIRTYGGPGEDKISGLANGGGIIAFTGSSSSICFVSAWHPNGKQAWASTGNPGSFPDGISISADKKGNVLVYQTGNDAMLRRYDRNGIPLWSKAILLPGGHHQPFVATCESTSYLVYSGANSRIIIQQYDPSGDEVQTISAGSELHNELAAVACRDGGELFITGKSYGKAGFGSFALNGNGYMFNAMLSPEGDFQWAMESSASPEAIGITASGLIYITGTAKTRSEFGEFTVPATGMNTFLAKLDEKVILSGHERWSCLANGQYPGSGWKQLSFSEQGWNKETSPVHSGRTGQKKYTPAGTAYFRKVITLYNPSRFSAYELRLMRDDGAVVYINGREVIRSNMMPGRVLHSSRALSVIKGLAEEDYSIHFIPASSFVNGRNIIAVEIHQAGDADLSFAMQLSPADMPGCKGEGYILSEYWENVPGDEIGTFSFEDIASGSSLITGFESPSNTGDQFIRRISGYLCVPKSGYYTFWISGDNNCELWLSTDDSEKNRKLIARVETWTKPGEWNKEPSQKSEPVLLSSGEKYFIVAIQKEGSGNDHIAVGWQMPDGVRERPIPGMRLSPLKPAPPSFSSPLNKR